MIMIRMGRNANGRFTGLCEVEGGNDLAKLLDSRRRNDEGDRKTMKRIILEASAGFREKGYRHCFDLGPDWSAQLRALAEAHHRSFAQEAEAILRGILEQQNPCPVSAMIPRHRPGPEFIVSYFPVGKPNPVLRFDIDGALGIALRDYADSIGKSAKHVIAKTVTDLFREHTGKEAR